MELIEPPKDPSKLPEWIREYIKPKKESNFKAHQFTINGVTYPFVRDLHFAAVPYPINRRYSMLAGLFTTRPGDLLFFFQSDPQWASDDINSRRGLRGIYRIISKPFHDNQPITHPGTKYTLLGVCPHCKSSNANLSSKCIVCNQEYPQFIIPSKGTKDPYHLLVMGCRLDIEPLIIFERSVSDERTYADMSDTGMVWIGRHDNQMGAGKGSSIRQLLPEEAVKIARLMLTEPGQKITIEKKVPYPNPKLPILNSDGTPADYMEIKRRKKAGDFLIKELALNYYISKTIDDPKSNISKVISPFFDYDKLEYFSNEFPWGYTAGESDFICCFAKEDGRFKIIPVEFKRDWIDDDSAIQVSLYVPWVVQIMSQFAVPPPTKLEVIPIFIGRRLKEGTSIPKGYSYKAKFNSGVEVDVDVKSPVAVEYIPIDIKKNGDSYYAENLDFVDKSGSLSTIDWKPPTGVVTSQIEREWVKDTSWKEEKDKLSD